MCGIVGLYNFAAETDTLARMLRAVAHRGPDAEGIAELQSHGADVRLGHRRLSIIDLSDAANQPFEKDGLVVVYNGEIYNYQAVEAGAGGRWRPVPDHLRHGGPARGLAPVGRRQPQSPARHVRLRHARPTDRPADPRPGPFRHQAAVHRAPARRPRFRVRAQGAGPGARRRAGDRLDRSDLIADVLLGSRSALRLSRGREAAAGPLGRDLA